MVRISHRLHDEFPALRAALDTKAPPAFPRRTANDEINLTLPPENPWLLSARPKTGAPLIPPGMLRAVAPEHVQLDEDTDDNANTTLTTITAATPVAIVVAIGLAPIRWILDQGTPVTDWNAALHDVDQQTVHRISRELVAVPTRALDAIANVYAFARHQVHADLTDLLAAIDGDLVDAYAALIQSEATP